MVYYTTKKKYLCWEILRNDKMWNRKIIKYLIHHNDYDFFNIVIVDQNDKLILIIDSNHITKDGM